MNAEDARGLLKKAIDPGLAVGLGLSAGAAGLLTKKLLTKKTPLQKLLDAVKKHGRAAVEVLAHPYKPEEVPGHTLDILRQHLASPEVKVSSSHEENRKRLHKIVRPLAAKIPYKTKGAKGWDVMVDAMLGDDPGTAASK